MNKKIVFLDVDGTLISYQKYLPQSSIDAIKMARNNGHLIFLCTGRSKAQIYKQIWDIGFDGYIGGNGSYIEYKNEVIYHKLLSKDECKEIVNYLNSKSIEYYLESNNGLFLSENFEKVGGDAFIKYHKLLEVDNYKNTTVYTALQGIKKTNNYYRDDINKISYVLNNNNDYIEVSKKFNNLEHGTWGGNSVKPIFGYIASPSVIKGQAIKYVLDYLKIDKQDSISIGDSNIDISMFEATNVSICLGGGTKDAKDKATFITDTLENDGLYKAFKKYELI